MEAYRDYNARWGVLLTVFLLNIANNALWISFSAVSDLSAKYYQKSFSDIDWLGTIGFMVGIPTCLASTWICDRFGLRLAVHIGAILTALGGLMRAISSFPGTDIDLKTQYWMVFIGQALTGLGNPMAVSVPTKVSQHWFGESQRTFATIFLAMSLPLGIVLGQGVTPTFVKEASDVATMNWVWSIPALLTLILCILLVRSSKPPSPPSPSADQVDNMPYIKKMKALLCNKNYIAINIAIGGAVGYFNCIATQLQQFMCSRGYSTEFSGMCGSLLLGTGFVGSIISGLIVEKYGHMEEIAKICYAIASLVSILIAEFLRKSNQEAVLALSCALFGVFGFGMYPLGLELSVENTYPVDEAAGTALIFLSGQIQGAILVMISGALERDLKNPQVSTCDKVEGKDHTNFLLFIAGYTTFLCSAFIILLKTSYKRTSANKNNVVSSQVLKQA